MTVYYIATNSYTSNTNGNVIAVQKSLECPRDGTIAAIANIGGSALDVGVGNPKNHGDTPRN